MKQLLMTCLLMAGAAMAQTYYGTILGTVRDSSEALHPGVTVKVTNLETLTAVEVMSNDAGNYLVPNLVPGKYRVEATQTGFKRFLAESVALGSAQDARVDVRMEIGGVSESITVSGEAAQLETERGTITDTKSNFEFNTVPANSNYRSIYRLLSLSPGITASAGYIAGNSRGSNSTFNIDGVPMIDGWSGGAVGPAFTYLDAYREFRIDLASVGASTGTTAAVSVVSESGTNQYRGEAWLHYNAIGFVARPFFAPTSPSGPPIYRPNIKFGGPLRLGKLYDGRNRTFFHFTYQGLRGSQLPQTSNFTVPNTAFRTGDFSSLGKAVIDPRTNQPFAGNRIPTSQINAVSKYFQDSYYPAANSGATQFTNVAVFPNTDDQYVGRMDHQISKSNSIFGRVMYHHYVFQNLTDGNPKIGIYDQYRDQWNAVISDTHTFSSRLFNEFRFGYGVDDSAYHGPLRGRDVVSASGLNLGTVPDVYAFPTMNITGYQRLGQSDQGGWQWKNYYIVEGMHYVTGRHNLHFGVDWANFNGTLIPTSPSAAYGSYSFSGRFSGDPYADFLLGLMDNSARSTSVSPVYRHRTNWAMYITDSFKVNSRLSLEFGLRYSLLDPGYTENNVFSNFDPAKNALIVPDEASKKLIHPGFPLNVPILTAQAAGLPAKLVRFDKNNFAPRLGFAWRPGKGQRMVVRGGAGVYYAALHPNPSDGGGVPFELRESFTNQLINGAPQFTFPIPFPTSGFVLGGTSATGMNTSLPTPLNYQYNLTVEQEVAGTVLSGTYMSTLARNNTWSRNLNQPVANTQPYTEKFLARPFGYLASASYVDTGANHNYHALMMKADRRFQKGLFLSTNFTYSRSMGDDWTTPEDAFNRARERSQGGQIPRLRFVATGIYELPIGRGKPLAIQSKALNAIFGGWLVAGTWVSQTGAYFTPSYSGTDPSNTNRFSGRPDRIGDGNLAAGSRTLLRWFDTAAFVAPANGIGRFGTAGDSILEGPALNVLHTSVNKEFFIHERLRVRLEGVATNALNHPNFSNPNATLGSATYGRLVSTAGDDGNRNLQLALRVIF